MACLLRVDFYGWICCVIIASALLVWIDWLCCIFVCFHVFVCLIYCLQLLSLRLCCGVLAFGLVNLTLLVCWLLVTYVLGVLDDCEFVS